MVAIDSGMDAGRQPVLNVKIPLAGMIGAAAVLVALGAMALNGFNERGLRLSSEMDWRFASFLFVLALVAGPVCRMLPSADCEHADALRRQLLWGFCASYGVFLAATLLPNFLGSVGHSDMTAGMTVFAVFGGVIVAVMAYATSRDSAALVGEPARRALLTVSGAFFWLTYALTGLAHLSGPHRPDAFYGVSLSLMIFALLLRFADRFVARVRRHEMAPGF